jgi:hypothetical protein
MNVPEPADPAVRLEVSRDPLLLRLWAEFCEHQASQGFDPNNPSPYTRSFRDYANQRMDPFIEGAGRVQYEGWKRPVLVRSRSARRSAGRSRSG